MNNDRSTKALLAIIAIGLWLNLGVRWLAPRELGAQDTATIERYVRQIATGTCTNSKIC